MVRSNERMSIGQINVQSIYAKRNMLELYLTRTSMDVILISETWERENKTFRMKGYEFLSKSREDGYGGVAILFRKTIRLQCVPLPQFEFLEAIAAKTANLDKNLYFVSVYVAPAQNVEERDKSLRDFAKLFRWMNGKSDLVLGGDMNAHSRMWGCMSNSVKGNRLAEIIHDSDFVLLNDGRPTRVVNMRGTANALDLSIVSKELAVKITWDITDENLGGDHYMIVMIMNENRIYKNKREIMNGKKWTELMNEILSTDEIKNGEQLEYEIENVNEMCVKTVDSKDIKVNEWWNNEIKHWYDKKRNALREFNGCICSLHFVEYKRCNAKLKLAIRKAKRKSWRNYVSKMNRNTSTRDIWQQFNRVRGQRASGKNYVLDDRENGNQFLRMMVNVNDNLNIFFEDLRENVESGMDRKFEWDEFREVLDNAKPSTPGINRVNYRMIQGLSMTAQSNLLDILNQIWMEGKLPQKWKESRVVPIPKRDRDPKVATNYRGICMLNVLMKVVNGMFKTRMEQFMNENKLLPSTTYGFRKNHSAIECIERLIWEVRKDKKKCVVVSLDVERAYDFVVPERLGEILLDFNFSKKSISWIINFIQNRKLVLIGQDYRLEEEVSIGLPQGSKISPTLFNLYTSGIHRINENNKVVLQFADDFIIIGKGETAGEAMVNAQAATNRVIEDLARLNLKVNPNKCNCMGFRMNVNRALDIRIGSMNVEKVNVFRYLGIWIDQRLSFKKHMEILADSCKKRVNTIKRVSFPKWGAHPRVTDMLRKSVVSSKILYGISVYGNGSKVGIEKLIRVENACLRLVLGAVNSTPVQVLYSESGDSPLRYKREWVTIRETVRMIVNKNNFIQTMISRIQERPLDRNTFRAELILENLERFLSIGNAGRSLKPENLHINSNFGNFKKCELNESIVKKEFFKIKWEYQSFFEVYTDASVNENGVGVGIFIHAIKIERAIKLESDVCIMNAELLALYEGIKLAMNAGGRKIVVFSDSQSGMKLLMDGGGDLGNTYVDMIYECIKFQRCEVRIQWIPSHLGILGNERADMLAKRGSMENEAKLYEKKDARDVLRMFQGELWNKWENEFESKCLMTGKKYRELVDAPLRIPFFKILKGDTRMIRTMERVRMNHGNWKENLYKRHLNEDNMCEKCMAVEDIEHLILKCTKYNQIRSQFNVLMNARSLTELLKMNEDTYKNIYEFIRMAGITV